MRTIGPHDRDPFHRHNQLPPTLAVLATAAAYSATLSFKFVYDDNQQIILNPMVQSWRNVPDYFVKNVWSQWGLFAHSVYYRPIFLAWLLLNFKLFGLSPMWWHLSTLCAHLAATWLVFVLTRQVTDDSYTSLIAALLFGLQPVHVEAVAWISGVTDPLLAIFLLCSSLYYLRARVPTGNDGGKRLHFVVSLALFALALLTKETAAVFPAIIVVYEWVLGPSSRGPFEKTKFEEYSRRAKAAFAQAFPYFALLLAYLVIRALVLKSLVGTVTPLSLGTQLFTIPSLALLYIKHLLWPFNLSVFYNIPYVNTPGLSNFLLPMVLITLVAAVLLWWARRSRAVGVAAAWLMLPILPALKISAYRSGDIFHDRYVYLPSIGFAILVAVGLRQIGSAIAKDYYYTPAVVALILACLYGYGAMKESRYWASNLKLYSRALELTPNHVDATSNLAAELVDERRFSEAIPYYKKVIKQRPDAWQPYHGLSYCYYQSGWYTDAMVYIRRAIQLSPENPVLHLRLAIILIATDRLDEAEDEGRKALALQTSAEGINLRFQGGETGRDFVYHFTLGEILKRRGDLQAALAEFKAGLANQPDEVNAQMARQTVGWLETELSKAESKR